MPKAVTSIRWTVERAASELGVDRRTLTKRIRAGDIQPGSDGKFSTEQICAAVFGDSRREQLREMRARADKLELEVQCTRKERIPIEDMTAVDNEVFTAMAGIIKSNLNKVMTIEVINELFAQMRSIPDKLGWPGVPAYEEPRDLD